LTQIEQQRVQRLAFYASILEIMKTGRDAQGRAVANPVREFKPGPDGLISLQGAANAEVVRGPDNSPLQALQQYENQLALRNEELISIKAKGEQILRQLADLTKQMQGDGAQVVGLIRQKEIQVDAKLRVIAEQERLKPELANRFAETTIMLKREAELRRRLQERGAATASTGRPERIRP
jgi:hypothetical protein